MRNILFFLLFYHSMYSQCLSNVNITTANYSTSLTESLTYIKINSTVASSAYVKLDANPSKGYVEMNPGFEVTPSTNGEYIAMALDGCGGLIPSKEALPNIEKNITETNYNIAIFPNPVNDKINIQFDNTESSVYDFQIFDLNGKIILEKSLNPTGKSASIDLSYLQSNVYIYKLKSSGNTIKEGRLLKK